MYALLCKPVPVITPTKTVIQTRDCRMIQMAPTQKENVYQIEILEAPLITVPDEDVKT